jgi:hypothetical protein
MVIFLTVCLFFIAIEPGWWWQHLVVVRGMFSKLKKAGQTTKTGIMCGN